MVVNSKALYNRGLCYLQQWTSPPADVQKTRCADPKNDTQLFWLFDTIIGVRVLQQRCVFFTRVELRLQRGQSKESRPEED